MWDWGLRTLRSIERKILSSRLWKCKKCKILQLKSKCKTFFSTFRNCCIFMQSLRRPRVDISFWVTLWDAQFSLQISYSCNFSECKRFACKIEAQRKACKSHFKIRKQSWPSSSQTSRKRRPLVLIKSITQPTNQNSSKYHIDQWEFITLPWQFSLTPTQKLVNKISISIIV